MADWRILPDGNLINLDKVEFINIQHPDIFLKTSTHSYCVTLDDEWRNILNKLSVKGDFSNGSH